MFYSQFILAKKGPLGTIWIAAHLERKLRKNQVADTDIGVSVDSILFPEVPIALRLSSHLLLGVVRIYSRKVNYLFDDCSEALLKIKQAFRSTAVDLPPEESTAPYHSITLPETFDLDDFELPDSDIFQGNYVDHHVSTREQITLQDTMEGVVYSTTQFGLDERFGDGDTSGLDLDEELFLNKVTTAPEHAGVMPASDTEPHPSVQPMTPLQQDKNHEGINGNSEEEMVAIGIVNELEGLAGSTDFIEYAQAPCTPGLVEEPNLSKTQEASVCDDHLELGEEPNLSNIQEASECDDHPESEDHNRTKFAAKENLANNTSNSDLHSGNENAVSWSNDMNPGTVLGGQEINQLKTQGDSPSTAGNSLSAEPVQTISPPFEFPDRNCTAFDGANRLQNLQNGVVSNNEPGNHSICVAYADSIEPQGVRLDETVSCPSFSDEARVLEDSFGNFCSGIENISDKSGTCQPVSECLLEINQASLRSEVPNNEVNAGNVEKSSAPSNSVASNIESPGIQDLENPETLASQNPKDSKILNSFVHEKLEAIDVHILHPCTHLAQSTMLNPGCDMSVALAPHSASGVNGLCSMETSEKKEVPHAPGASTEIQGEWCHATDFMQVLLMENHSTEPASCEDIQVDLSKSNDQVDNVISIDTLLKNVDASENSELPAPEKLLSVSERPADVQDSLLVESTPEKTHLVTGDEADAGINIISGRKRSFTESTLTVQSLNSDESLGMFLSKRSKESVPDDNDLLSSILVGRRSSVLKMKPTPPPPLEITCMKRPRSASRVSASKRKVLLDDAMVLHGDVIRQQLTSTEDIRRIRKKAPCTHPEIWMIQKEFLEDEIFSEPIFTGLSAGLALLHSQTYDLSKIRVSPNDDHNAFLEAVADQNLILQKDEMNRLEASNDMEFFMEPNVNKETGMEGINESIVVRDDVAAETPENQQGEDHVLQSQGYGSQVQMETINNVPEPQSSPHEHSREIAEIDIDGASNLVADAVIPTIGLWVESVSSTDPVLGDKNNMPAGSMVPSVLLDIENAGDSSVQLDASVEIGANMQTAFYSHTDDANSSLANSSEIDRSSNQVVVNSDHAMEEIRKNEQGVLNEVLPTELDYDDKNLASYGFSEEPKEASSYPVEQSADVKNASLNDGEYPGCQEADPHYAIDAETAALDHTAAEDHDDFDCTIDEHDTGFLNADDDDIAEEDEDYMPGAEQTNFLENSGWSSRTRAVAKYLQVLYEKESEHGTKTLPMDNLLVGKTRKEASRMFFEALVLKTKDYIHVEQVSPFDNINIKPRMKLMKSDF